jgi:hypothetical protein
MTGYLLGNTAGEHARLMRQGRPVPPLTPLGSPNPRDPRVQQHRGYDLTLDDALAIAQPRVTSPFSYVQL